MKGSAGLIIALLVIASLGGLFGIANSQRSALNVAIGTGFTSTTSLVAPYEIGQTFSYTFKLPNTDAKTLPYTSSDGIQRETLWYVYTIRDAGNNKMISENPVSVTNNVASLQNVSIPVSYVIPQGATSGKYMSASVLYKVPQVYDVDANQWTQGEQVVLSKSAVSFSVAGVRPPVSNWWQDLLERITGFFATLFGWHRII